MVVIGTYCQVYGLDDEFERWREGLEEFTFGTACSKLGKAPSVEPLNLHLQAVLEDSIFNQKDKTKEPVKSFGGWARRQYSLLCKFSHSNPYFTNITMWQSNGPIYVPLCFELAESLYLETSALCYILVKLGRPHFTLPTAAQNIELFRLDGARRSEIAYASYRFLFGDA